MRVEKRNGREVFVYKKDLQKELTMSKKELDKLNEEISIYEKIYEKAKKEYMSKYGRISDLKQFIELVEKELEKRKAESEA